MALLPETLKLQVVTPDRLVVSEEVAEVQVPGKNGYMGILPGHAPLLSELTIGEVSYRRGTSWEFLAVAWGFVEVLPHRVIVLAETSERAEDIDVDRAQAARQRAEARLARTGAEGIDIDRAQAALQRALIRLQVASKRRAGARPGAPFVQRPPAL